MGAAAAFRWLIKVTGHYKGKACSELSGSGRYGDADDPTDAAGVGEKPCCASVYFGVVKKTLQKCKLQQFIITEFNYSIVLKIRSSSVFRT
jgi:hypothetical protein